MTTQQIETTPRTKPNAFLLNSKVIMIPYIIAITIAELVTTYSNPNVGIAFHAIIAVILLLHWSYASQYGNFDILIALLSAPMIRLLSLALPLFMIPIKYWYLAVSIPLYIAAFIIMRTLGYSFKSLLGKRKDLFFHLGIGSTGLIFGVVEYSILHTTPIIDSPTLPNLVVGAFVMTVGTGIMEELVFRGILQKAAEKSLGKLGGLLFAAIIFTMMHIGWQSLIDLFFVFTVGSFWGYIFQKRSSILGTSISHSLTNILLFLILPFVFPAAPTLPHLLPVVAPTPAPIVQQAPEVLSTSVPENAPLPQDNLLARPTDLQAFVQTPPDSSSQNKNMEQYVEYAEIAVASQIYLLLIWVSLMRVPILKKLRRIKG